MPYSTLQGVDSSGYTLSDYGNTLTRIFPGLTTGQLLFPHTEASTFFRKRLEELDDCEFGKC